MKKKERNLLILSILPFLVIIAMFLIDKNLVNNFDRAISFSIFKLRNPSLSDLFIKITNISDPKTLIAIVLAVSLFLIIFTTSKRLGGWYIIISIINMVFVCNIVKFLVGRPRPDLAFRLVEVSSKSFPSGHAFNTIVAYGGLIYIIYKLLIRKEKRSKLPYLLILFLIILAILVAFSRIYLGVHYLTDIIGGLSLGLFSLLLSIYLYEVKYEK